MKYSFLILLFVFTPLKLKAQSCSTSGGIDLSVSPGSYSNLYPRNQGSVGTCYAHSGTDLLSSFLKIPRLNVYDAAINTDADVDGGQPSEVMKGLIERGWACKDFGQFANLFPSTDKNIITDLMDAVARSGMPVFYSMKYDTPEGAARQKRIAELAGKMASGEIKPCGAYVYSQQGLSEFQRLEKEISRLDDKLKTLRDEKDVFDGWFGTRDTQKINADIAVIIAKKKKLEEKSEKAHDKYLKGSDLLERGQNYLDNYTELQAAEIVYYWAEKTYPAVKAAFEKYGASSWAPTMKQYIIEKVQRDPQTGYWVAGGLYPYHLLKRLIRNACTGDNRVKIPKELKSKTMLTKDHGVAKMTNKLEALLVKNPGQGVGITIQASILQSTGSGLHAVNIIGCRTVNGTKEYLIHNSWGSDCNSYHTRYRGADKCKSGRVWIPATTVMNAAKEIQWLEK